MLFSHVYICPDVLAHHSPTVSACCPSTESWLTNTSDLAMFTGASHLGPVSLCRALASLFRALETASASGPLTSLPALKDCVIAALWDSPGACGNGVP